MALKYLIDENVNPIYPNQIRLREPDIIIKVVGESKTPPKSTLYPEILCWCNDYQPSTTKRNSKTVSFSKNSIIRATRAWQRL
ncbi:MAG: hypothetical protein HC862_18195 [Scytonema sp. RU_4_4]|nr:hypothetical protein [Scytonema sp. RU_4_4]NJR73086.1 hypothetical protein [Scytonema sp. CRU_2_7]